MNKKRILAAILAACSLLCLCACNDEVANVKGENTVGGYSFSYPETWELLTEGENTVISISDVGGSVPYAVMRFTPHQSNGKTAEQYWLESEDDFKKIYSNVEIKTKQSFGFDGGTAFEAVMDATVAGFTNLDGQPDKADGKADYFVRQLVFQKEDRLCVVSYMATKANDEEHRDAFNTVKNSFAFTSAEKAEAEDKDVADFDVPVPEGWTKTADEAYLTLVKGNASISVSVFSRRDNATDAKACWEEQYVESFKTDFADYTLVGELKEDARLGGAAAVEAEYTLTTFTGNTYNFRQITAVNYDYVYTIVLTASPEDYEDCQAGYDAVVAGFSFK